MPEEEGGGSPRGSGGRWRRLLPGHARERLFDPAIADLVAEGVRRQAGPPPRIRVALLVLECLRLSFPRAFVRNRRPTAFAWGMFATLVVLVALATLRSALKLHYVNVLDPYE